VFVNFPKRVSGGSHNASFRSTMEYLLNERKHPEHEVIAGSVDADTARDATRIFGYYRAMRPDIAKPCAHFAIGYAPEDGERVREHQALRREIAGHLVQELIEREYIVRAEEAAAAGREPPRRPDPNAYAWLMVTHHEKGHVHDHVVLCRIGGDGTVWIGKNEAKVARTISRELESTYGLREIDRPGQALRARQRDPQHTHPRNDREQAEQRRTKTAPARAQVAARLRGWLAEHEGGRVGLAELQAAMTRHGIQVLERRDAYGQLRGHVVASRGQQWTGAQLGFRGQDTIAAALARCGDHRLQERSPTRTIDR
jgi:hypothetical protein